MSSTIDSSFITKAHILVKKAQEAEHFGLIDEAIEFHLQASNYFNLAILQTTNEQTISALKILSHNHLLKSTELKQYQDLKSTDGSQQQHLSSSSSSVINVGASPVAPTDSIPNIDYFTQPSTSPNSLWVGIEKLLDILPKPLMFQRQRKSTDRLPIDGSLLNSFFFVEAGENNNNQVNNEVDDEDDIDMDDNRGVLPQSMVDVEQSMEDSMLKLRQELNLVNQTVKVLIDENERNARYLRNMTQENVYLKRCIIQFRQEIEKKTLKMKMSDQGHPSSSMNSSSSTIPTTSTSNSNNTNQQPSTTTMQTTILSTPPNNVVHRQPNNSSALLSPMSHHYPTN
ncbi:hypothetical protein SAMD00019534_021860 [Acytostelium subglobosum LB1]|uniref:hypothetical protein n=1 Tax=Acytostelium subglobosum LB1 TaxID=1410327 RepID=UPI000644A2D1|nr:hypothetical protein SAMD00019534_021860 [Acytostelium subglobosum LB1]GAM19011.1 hypothetical protein SAMD00019534_021860 [Acytostelium subglobosum LB1]|eukprot:XP_012756938.1 hypothetical protein SAMD00019534_021860 [Acytostelium subglobosum LB1]